MKTQNWIHGWLKSIWKSKAVPDYKKNIDKQWVDNALDLGRISAYGKVNKRNKEKEYKTITDEVKFNKSGVPKDFKDREFDGAFKECGCLPDCGCKETKEDKLKGWLP